MDIKNIKDEDTDSKITKEDLRKYINDDTISDEVADEIIDSLYKLSIICIDAINE